MSYASVICWCRSIQRALTSTVFLLARAQTIIVCSNVLDGMGEVLKSHRVRNVVVEVWPQGLETAGSNAEELLSEIAVCCSA